MAKKTQAQLSSQRPQAASSGGPREGTGLLERAQKLGLVTSETEAIRPAADRPTTSSQYQQSKKLQTTTTSVQAGGGRTNLLERARQLGVLSDEDIHEASTESGRSQLATSSGPTRENEMSPLERARNLGLFSEEDLQVLSAGPGQPQSEPPKSDPKATEDLINELKKLNATHNP